MKVVILLWLKYVYKFAKKITAHNLKVSEYLNLRGIVIVFVMKPSESAAVDCMVLFK